MKLIQTKRETLLKPLQAVIGIVERRHTLPILSNILLELQQEAVNIVATDLEIQISATGAIPKTKNYSVTVSGKKMLDILRALPEGQEINLESLDSRLKIVAGGSRFSLQTLPAEDFPKLSETERGPATLKLAQRDLKKLLIRTQFSMAQQDIRYYLNGMLLLVEGSVLTAVATDGHRLSLASVALNQAYDRMEAILPRKAILEMVKLLTEGDEEVELEILLNQVKVRVSGAVLVSKLVDGKFPDYKRVIPTSYQKSFTIDRVTLLQALQRAAILSNEKFKGVRWVLTGNTLTVVCNNSEQEEAQEELAIEYNGDALDIGFNITYLLDVLTNTDSPVVSCAFGDANSSTLITLPESQDFKYVVMPMRI